MSFVMGIGTFSRFAGVNSALYFRSLWERQRGLVSSIISTSIVVQSHGVVKRI